jgi:DNA-binding NarL/FixJ family response regulator
MVPPPGRRTGRGVRGVNDDRLVVDEPVRSASAEGLTRRELEVLQLIAEGCPNHEIGERLFLSEETVKSHVKTLLEKLQARTRAHAVAVAIRHGVIT